LEINLVNGGGAAEPGVDAHAHALLGSGRAATAGHDLHASQAHARARADQVLARAANGALRLGAEQHGQVTNVGTGVGTAGLAGVGPAGALGLGADGRGHTGTGVGQAANAASRALHVGRLGGVLKGTLLRLDDVLAVSRHHNDAALLVHVLGGGLGGSGTTTRHWYYNSTK